MSSREVLDISAESAPYFRTPEFSQMMLENEELMLRFLNAPEGSRCAFLTASGTGAMESVVMNVLSPADKVLVVNGGSFGARFVQLCRLHKLQVTEVPVGFGHQLRADQLEAFAGQGCTALLVNMDETSSGLLYDMPMIAEFCKYNGIMLVVDAISAFLSDPLDMEGLGAAVVITGSQKALAVQPGVSVVALSPGAVERVYSNDEACMYLSLKEALKNGERGQTPWTPAVSILLQINARLRRIESSGGVEAEQERIAGRAQRFRALARDLGLEVVAESPSNAVTGVRAPKGNARQVFSTLKDDYGIWVCPNGGDRADEMLRVGHIGSITADDEAELADALRDLRAKGIL